MVKQWIAVGVLVLGASVPALAQAPRQTEAEQVKARQRISMMEGTLERAVRNGAENLLRQVDSVMPDGLTLSSLPQVRGFRLEGYGIFFDVGVPALRPSIAWMLRSMQNGPRITNSALNELKMVQATTTDSAGQARLGRIIQQLELSLAPAAPRVAPRPGALTALSVLPPQNQVAEPSAVDNPEAAWTELVKTAIVEAMLENSGPLAVGDDEWLTVAATDSAPSDPLVPGDTVGVSTVIFRVKGSVLSAFHSKRMTLDEARKRVEVTEN